ncbi:MAG: hypothetical protein AAGN82_26385, partial [Myxococcota bacterium]
ELKPACELLGAFTDQAGKRSLEVAWRHTGLSGQVGQRHPGPTISGPFGHNPQEFGELDSHFRTLSALPRCFLTVLVHGTVRPSSAVTRSRIYRAEDRDPASACVRASVLDPVHLEVGAASSLLFDVGVECGFVTLGVARRNGTERI